MPEGMCPSSVPVALLEPQVLEDFVDDCLDLAVGWEKTPGSGTGEGRLGIAGRILKQLGSFRRKEHRPRVFSQNLAMFSLTEIWP